MAWKMRKDKAPTAPAEEGASLADTTVSEEAVNSESQAVQESAFQESAFQDFGGSPFVMAPAEDELLPLHNDAVIAPPVFEEEIPLAPPVFDFTPVDTQEAHPDTAEPAYEEPAFEETSARGPFAPFQPAASEEAQTAPPLPESLDRDTIAPSLVHAASDMDVPRVAPFIVDLPPVMDTGTAATGALTIRIGNFTAPFQVAKDVTLIGRPDSVQQSYPDVEIELDDAVSRRHAEIRHRDGQYFLVDLNSTNGTLLNGRTLEPDQEYPLSPGDRIHLGDRTEIIFE